MIVRFQFETTLLDRTVRETSVGPLSIEQLDVCRDVPLRSAVSVPEVDAESIERALHRDPSVETAHPVQSNSGETLYQVAADPDGATPEAYHAAVENGGVLLDGTRDADGLQLQLSFPDRTHFSTFQQICADEGVSLTVKTMHQEHVDAWADQYDLTDPQREVLELAVEMGYFTVPREASLADLATELDVSSQAVSERLRRGLDSVVEHTVVEYE